jgi:hypothetical protein
MPNNNAKGRALVRRGPRRENEGEGGCQPNSARTNKTNTRHSIAYDASPRLVTRLDQLSELHADAWGGLERFANALANAGIVWHNVPGASDLFGSLDKAGVLAFRIRRELSEDLESEAA